MLAKFRPSQLYFKQNTIIPLQLLTHNSKLQEVSIIIFGLNTAFVIDTDFYTWSSVQVQATLIL